MTRFAAALAALALLILASPVHADDPVVVDLRIDAPDVITVGDRVRYTVVAEVDAGTGIALAPSALPPEVELIDRPQMTRIPLDNGRDQVTITFQVAPFVAGDVFVPSLPLRYTSRDGPGGIIESPSSVIEVTSVLPAGQVGPRDLKAQAEYGTPPPTWPIPAAIAVVSMLLLLLLALFVRGRLRRYRASRALRHIPVFAGAEDMARGMLDRTASDFAESGDLVAYYTDLGNVVRHYLTARYDFPAFALTTRELADEMHYRGLDRWQVRVATGLLTQCDAVVYARYRPAAERADADLTAAYEIVEMSRPLERPPLEREEVAVS